MSKKLSYTVVALAVMGLVSRAMAQAGKGNILVEEWFSAPANTITSSLFALKVYPDFPDKPHKSYWAKEFDRPDGGEDYWGGRFRGYLYPPQTGTYTFWTCSDDDSELYLSTDENLANATLIASVTGWMPYRAWDGTGGSPGTNFKSAPITLTAGQKYYIEALWCDGYGGGFISVGWGGPGIGRPQPVVIDGKYLSPIIRDPEPMFPARNPIPAHGAVGVLAPLIQWTAGATAMWHDFYFGTDPNPPLIGRQVLPVYWHAAGFEAGTTYYWKVNEVEVDGVTIHEGPIWSFTSDPLKAFSPKPDDGASGQMPGLILTWNPGQGATGQQVYFGMDQAAVTTADASVNQGKLTETTFHTGALRASTTYFWRVDTIKTGGVVRGDVWSFSTIDAGPPNKITYEVWKNISGTAIGTLTNSRVYPAPGALAVTFAVTETAGKMSLTSAGNGIWGTSDQFTYAYKSLKGDGSMTARVVSYGTGSSDWARGGVMIRDSLNGNSTHATMILTSGAVGGAAFHWRPVIGTATQSVHDLAPSVAPPYWVKIERQGDRLIGSVSADGKIWRRQGETTITMTAPVYIGLCVTSRIPGENRTYEFDNISSTGDVSGKWQGAIISTPIHPIYNSPQDLYVAVEDSTGKSTVATDATAVTSGTWTEVKFPLDGFAGVNLTQVKKLHIGVGSWTNPAVDGSGLIFVDDIRIYNRAVSP